MPQLTKAPPRDPRYEAVGATVPWSRLEVLGLDSGATYATYDGREWAILPASVTDPVDLGHKSGEIIVSEEYRETLVDGSVMIGRRYRRGVQAEAGTYARLSAQRLEREAARAARVAAREAPHPIDMLARHACLAGTPERIVPLGGAAAPAGGTLPDIRNEAMDIVTRANFGGAQRPGVLVSPGRGPLDTFRAIVETAGARGHRLTVTAAGRLMAEGRGGWMTDDWVEVYRAYERPIVGVLTDHPALCEVDGCGEAETKLAPDVLASRRHLADAGEAVA